MIQIKRAVLINGEGAKIEIVEYKDRLTFKVTDQWGQKLVQDTNRFNEILGARSSTVLEEFIVILRIKGYSRVKPDELMSCVMSGPEI